MSATLITGRGGLGDAIYARPFVRRAAVLYRDVYVSTSWPLVFADLPVRPVKREKGLAVQTYHGERNAPSAWATAPKDARQVSLRYRWGKLARGASVLADMEAMSGIRLRSVLLDLPPLPEPPVPGSYAVVRPPARRLDYPYPAREPAPEYLTRAAELLQAAGLRVVSLGDYVPGLEEPDGHIPADVRLEHGELPLEQALALVTNAALVVSGPGWMLAACTASRAPMVVLGGGCGGRNSPGALVDRRLKAAHIQWVLPEGYCQCRRRGHACPKAIADFDERFQRAAAHARAVMARAA